MRNPEDQVVPDPEISYEALEAAWKKAIESGPKPDMPMKFFGEPLVWEEYLPLFYKHEEEKD